MYSLKAMEHFLSPRNAGRLEPGQGVGHGEALDPQCCGKCALDVRLVDGRVDESRFVTEGCSGAIAACSALTTLVEAGDGRRTCTVRAPNASWFAPAQPCAADEPVMRPPPPWWALKLSMFWPHVLLDDDVDGHAGYCFSE